MPLQRLELTNFQTRTFHAWGYYFEADSINSLLLADHASMILYNQVREAFQKEFFQGSTDKSIKMQDIERDRRDTFTFVHFGIRRTTDDGDYLASQPLPRYEEVTNANVFGAIYAYLATRAGLPTDSKTLPCNSLIWP